MKVVISSGHGKYIRGASGLIDEVDEARLVVESVAGNLLRLGVDVWTFHDDVSDDQTENLHRIVNYHNSKVRDLDVSVHFNAFEPTDKGMGTECLYVTQGALADEMADAISAASLLINRGPKYRTDLYFLNETAAPSILIETCFVDSTLDVELYTKYYDDICKAIAVTIHEWLVKTLKEDEV